MNNERRFNALARMFDQSVVTNIADHRPIKLLPCPWCEGPPVPIVQNDTPNRGYCEPLDDYGDNGHEVRAFVFCHECGAESPEVTGTIYDREDYAAVERQAVGLWQKRDARHRDLYDSGESRGLNRYPRPDESP
jgi:hypothetical protein